MSELKRVILWLVIPAIFVAGVMVLAQDVKTPAPAAPVKWAAKDDGVAAPAAVGARRDLTLRQRREMGLTLSNLVTIAKELKTEGDIDANTPRQEVAAAIAVRLESKNSAGFKGASALDWEKIMEFIERLMKFIEMFL